MTLNERRMRTEQLKQRLTGQMPRVLYDIDENDNSVTGVKTISIVDKPAIQSEFVVFGSTNASRQRYLMAKERMAKILRSR